MTNLRDAARDKPAATIVDVAKAAGVSPSTVSYVITGKRAISPATRRRVEECIRTLGYRRSPLTPQARIGVLAIAGPLPDGRGTGAEAEFFAAAAEAARELRFHLLLLTHNDSSSGLHRVTTAALADAVILTDVVADDPRVPLLLASGRPAVLVGATGRNHGLACVDFDFAPAGQECLSHLAGLGHRSIAHLGRDRHDLPGFLPSAARRDMKVAFRPCAPSPESVARCLDELLTPAGPTALVVRDELTLPLVLAEVERRGLRVPEDISVVGVCSDTVAAHQSIRPTAVVIPARELGALAVERAVQQLDGEWSADLELITPRLAVGDSTAGLRHTP